MKTVETISTIVFNRQNVDSGPSVFETPVMTIAIAKVSPTSLVASPFKASENDDDDNGDFVTSLVLPQTLQLSEISNTSEDDDDSIRTEVSISQIICLVVKIWLNLEIL